MKKKKILAIVLATSLALSLGLVTAVNVGATNGSTMLDSVNIGDSTSEGTHNLQGWSNPWSGCGWCGPDGNMRLIWGDGSETCAPENNWASVELDAGCKTALTLKMQHLDGSADDGFNVYVNDTLVGTYLDQNPANAWVLTTEFDISSWNFSGPLTIKFEATGIAWPLCGTYGQVAFNEIELWGADTTPPTIDSCASDLQLECGDPDNGSLYTAWLASVTASDNCDLDVTVENDGPSLGSITVQCDESGDTLVAWTATDDCGLTDTCSAYVRIVDTTPPEISVSVSPDTLWPPNHKMVDITATVTATDNCDPPPITVLDSVVSNEPDNAKGDGNTVNDIQFGADDYDFSLRAERAGSGAGRVYTITYTATDACGNSASASATVTVPLNMD